MPPTREILTRILIIIAYIPPLPPSSLGHVEECRQLRRDLALACARARDRERALKHSYAILSDAKTRQCSSEVAFLTDLLASLHLDDGDLTLAHNVLAHTIAFLEAPPEMAHVHVRLCLSVLSTIAGGRRDRQRL